MEFIEKISQQGGGDKNLFECTRFTDMKVSVKIKERRK